MKTRPSNWKTARILAIAVTAIFSEAFGVDVQSPTGDWVCRIEEGKAASETPTTISFGRLEVNSEETFVNVAEKPLIDFPKNGLYPLVTVCWSPKGTYCMVAIVNRKHFSIQIVDTSGKTVTTTGVEIDDPLDTKLAAFKLTGGLERWFRSAHWAGEGKLILLTEDDIYDEKNSIVRYEVEVRKKDGGWLSSVTKVGVIKDK